MAKHKHHDVIVAWAADTSKTVQYFNDGEWVDIAPGFASWSPNTGYRIKPEPPKVYPETLMTDDHCRQILAEINPNAVARFDALATVKKVANYSLRHAIENGQVVAADERVMRNWDGSKVGRGARDMAIALAVYEKANECIRNFLGEDMKVFFALEPIIASVKE